MSNAFFYLVFSEHPDRAVHLYLVTIASTTGCGMLIEVIDVGSRKSKAVCSVILYAVSMLTMLSHGQHDLYLIGRVVYGAAAALHHSSFEAYVVHEHGSLGFPDEWLGQTFALLTHLMALLAFGLGIIGQMSAAAGGAHGVILLSFVLFVSTAVYMSLTWSRDINTPRFMMGAFLNNVSLTFTSARKNRSLAYFILISALAESSFTVFSYYWAQLITSTVKEDAEDIPYALIFSAYVCTSMIGAYIHNLFASKIGVDIFFQGVLSGLVASFSLASMVQTPMVVFLSSLAVYGFLGAYWPCIGTLRARAVGAEQRASSQAIVRSLSTLLAILVLLKFHRSATIIMIFCALAVAVAAFFQSRTMQQVSTFLSA